MTPETYAQRLDDARCYLLEKGILEPVSVFAPPSVLARWLRSRAGALERAGLIPTEATACTPSSTPASDPI